MPTQDQEIEVMQKLARVMLAGLLGFAGLFVVAGGVFSMLMH
jgi:hypothetical protein